MLVFVIGDTHRTQKINLARNHEYRWERTDAFLNTTVDASLALAFMIAAAEGIGIGTCPVSKVRESTDSVARLLELPEGAFPICACALGYPKTRSKRYCPDYRSRLLFIATPTNRSISKRSINTTRHSTVLPAHLRQGTQRSLENRKKARGQKMSHGKQQCSSVQIFETRVRGWVYLGSRANSRSATNVSDSHISQ